MSTRFGLQSALLLCSAGSALLAQSTLPWRQSLSNLPPTPPASTTAADVARFERNLQVSAPYFAGLGPSDYEANRAMVRRMAAYLAGLRSLARDPQMQAAVNRAQQTFNTLPLVPLLGYTGSSQTPAPPPPETREAAPTPSSLPFPLSAPELPDISAADKALAQRLCSRYEADAAKAAAAWQNAGLLQQNLARDGMALNASVSASLNRLPNHLNGAFEALQRGQWEEAGTTLARAEAETEKILRTVGR